MSETWSESVHQYGDTHVLVCFLQQDIVRGRDAVDSLYQGGPLQGGTHNAILSSEEYLSTPQPADLNNIEDGFYISPAFLDKISIHVAKNFLDLPKIKVTWQNPAQMLP